MRHRRLPGCLCGAIFVFEVSQSQKAILSLMCLKRQKTRVDKKIFFCLSVFVSVLMTS